MAPPVQSSLVTSHGRFATLYDRVYWKAELGCTGREQLNSPRCHAFRRDGTRHEAACTPCETVYLWRVWTRFHFNLIMTPWTGGHFTAIA